MDDEDRPTEERRKLSKIAGRMVKLKEYCAWSAYQLDDLDRDKAEEIIGTDELDRWEQLEEEGVESLLDAHE